MEELQKQLSEFPVWAYVLLGIFMLFTLITQIITIFFVICYTFCWEKTRTWFNHKAGTDFMPAKRIEKPQAIAAVAGIGMVILSFISDAFPKSEDPSTLRFFNLQTLVIIGLLIYAAVRYRRFAKTVGAQRARWETVYLILSCLTIFAASGMAFTLFILIYALIFIFDKGGNFAIKSLHGGVSADGTPASSGKRFSCDHIRMLDGHCYQSGSKCRYLTNNYCPYGKVNE